MSISSTVNRAVYAGNGVTTAFSFPYEFFATTDLVVLETVIATGVATTKALTTDYTVSGTQDASGIYNNGGTVTAVTAPASTVKWTIYRDPAATQTTVFVDNDKLPAASLNNGLDKLTIICQRVKELILRAARLADGDISGADVTLPTPVASQLLGWNAFGTSIVSYAASTIASGVTITTFAATMLASASAAAWRTLLGLGYGAGMASDGAGNIVASIDVNAQNAPYTILAGDRGHLVEAATAGTYTLGAGTATAGWWCGFRNNSTSAVTLNTSLASIDGVASVAVQPGQSFLVQTGASVHRTIGRVKAAVSGQLTISAAGTASFTHGLGVEPTRITLELQCLVNDTGYLAGQHLVANPGTTGSANRGMSVLKGTTSVDVKFGSDASVFDVVNPTSGATVGLNNPGNWRLVIGVFA